LFICFGRGFLSLLSRRGLRNSSVMYSVNKCMCLVLGMSGLYLLHVSMHQIHKLNEWDYVVISSVIGTVTFLALSRCNVISSSRTVVDVVCYPLFLWSNMLLRWKHWLLHRHTRQLRRHANDGPVPEKRHRTATGENGDYRGSRLVDDDAELGSTLVPPERNEDGLKKLSSSQQRYLVTVVFALLAVTLVYGLRTDLHNQEVHAQIDEIVSMMNRRAADDSTKNSKDFPYVCFDPVLTPSCSFCRYTLYMFLADYCLVFLVVLLYLLYSEHDLFGKIVAHWKDRFVFRSTSYRDRAIVLL